MRNNLFQIIKRQIDKQSRKELDHVHIPETAGMLFVSKGDRAITVDAVLRYQRRSFILARPAGFYLDRQQFEAFGGDYQFATMNARVDGALNDSLIPRYANVEYTVRFVANSDVVFHSRVTINVGATAAICLSVGDAQVGEPVYIIRESEKDVSLSFRSGEQYTIKVYYYNTGENGTNDTLGNIAAFDGLGAYVASWVHADITPPATPEWHVIPLTTQAANDTAGTTNVRLQWQAPVIWPENWTSGSTGTMINPDLAGHNIYRVKYSEINAGSGINRIDSGVKPNTISVPAELSDFVHGVNISVTNTVRFQSRFNDDVVDDVSGDDGTIVGYPRFRPWGQTEFVDDYEYITNGEFSGVVGSVPSGWTFASISGGEYSAQIVDSKNGRQSLLLDNLSSSGCAVMSQNILAKPNKKYLLSVDLSNFGNGSTDIVVKKLDGLQLRRVSVDDSTYDGIVMLDVSSPTTSGFQVSIERDSGPVIINSVSITNSTEHSSFECASETRNYVPNGIFTSGYQGWQLLGVTNIDVDRKSSLFGSQVPIITCNSGTGFWRVTMFSGNGAATTSAYLKVYDGSVKLFSNLNYAVEVTSEDNGAEWKRYAVYSPTTPNAIYVIATTPDSVFSVDGAQIEAGRKLSAFDDYNIDGLTTRNVSYVTFPSSGIMNQSAGAIRFWYEPSFSRADLSAITVPLFNWLNLASMGSGYWMLYYNQVTDSVDLQMSSGGSPSIIGYKPVLFSERHARRHFVITWSGQTVEIWVDGKKANPSLSDYPTQTFRWPVSDPGTIYIGGFPGSTQAADGTFDAFLVDSRYWDYNDVHSDMEATNADITESFVVNNTISKKANIIPNSNFATRVSGQPSSWYISSGFGHGFTMNFDDPKYSDVCLRITTQ